LTNCTHVEKIRINPINNLTMWRKLARHSDNRFTRGSCLTENGESIMVRTLMSLTGAVVLAASLTACGTTTKQTVGTAGGAVLGGAAGSAVTGGSTLGTLGGAAVGGVIGNQVTKP
jgi:osmotically inducible lipoprotein OsmB